MRYFRRSSMYAMASRTLCIFSASSSGISMLNSSSYRITNSTVSSESAPRSSMNLAFGVTSDSSTPSSSTMICLTLSSIDSAIEFLQENVGIGATVKSHIHSAINIDHLPSDIACLIRGQKCNRVGHFEIGSGAFQRNLFQHRAASRFVERGGHRRLDEPRRHGVDCNVARRVFARHGFGEADDPGFRRNVVN